MAGPDHIKPVDIGQLPAAQRGVGLMFQDPLLFPHMTVGDNLAFGLTAARTGRAERRQAVLDALQECGLTDLPNATQPACLGDKRHGLH